MRRHDPRWVALATFLSWMAGCGNQTNPSATSPSASAGTTQPGQLPTPPLTIAEPPRPADLASSSTDGAAPQELASGLAAQGDYGGAVREQYRAVLKDDDGLYNLACYLARAGQVDAAFYWLQKAALDEGVDAAWAGHDPDLDRLRDDPRWSRISPFLADCNAYWASNGEGVVTLALPTGYQLGTPIPVAIYLHGMGANPESADEPLYHQLADELNTAIVGVSGTRPRGRRSFLWAEDVEADEAHIQAALDSLADRLTIQPGSLVAFGFSQGGQMAFEVAFRHPEKYRGAIVMSPGTTKNNTFAGLTAADGNRLQGFVLRCGGEEAPGNRIYVNEDADFARNAGARVDLKLYDGVARHQFPPDFASAFPSWVRFIRSETGSSLTDPLPPAPPQFAQTPANLPPDNGPPMDAQQAGRDALNRAREMHEQRMQELRRRQEERMQRFRGRHGFGP